VVNTSRNIAPSAGLYEKIVTRRWGSCSPCVKSSPLFASPLVESTLEGAEVSPAAAAASGDNEITLLAEVGF